MFEDFKNDLLNLGNLKIVSSFYCDPAIKWRSAADGERCTLLDRHDDQRELLIFLSGECERQLGDRVYRLVPGSALLIDVNEEHQGFYTADTPPGRYFWTIFRPEHMVYHLTCITTGHAIMLEGISNFHHYDPHWKKMLLDAWDRTRTEGARFENLVELSLIFQLHAARLVQLHDEAVAYDGYNTAKRNRARIRQVMDYIDIQCGRDCSIAALAQLAGCSRTNFLRNFRRHAGCSVLEYINRQRVLRCKSLLKPSYSSQQSTPLKVCAQELGFSSPQAFARWRKQHLGELRRTGGDGISAAPPPGRSGKIPLE